MSEEIDKLKEIVNELYDIIPLIRNKLIKIEEKIDDLKRE